jgi:hypothetical protein
MKVCLWIWFGISVFCAFMIFGDSQSAIHEILAALFAVQATITFCAIYVGNKISTNKG